MNNAANCALGRNGEVFPPGYVFRARLILSDRWVDVSPDRANAGRERTDGAEVEDAIEEHGIQGLQGRRQGSKPRRARSWPGRAERRGFEYYRHGTLSLYAALNVKTGMVEGNQHADTPARSSSIS